MKFVVAVLLVVLVVEINSVDSGVRNVEVSDSINSSSLQNLRDKRSLGVIRETKKEWDLKKKDGSSLHVTRQVSYNDGGAVQMLSALQDSTANNRIKVINQLQNGQGQPEIAQQMLSAASPGTTDFNIDTGIEGRHSRARIFDNGRFGYWKIVPRNNENTDVTTKTPEVDVSGVTVIGPVSIEQPDVTPAPVLSPLPDQPTVVTPAPVPNPQPSQPIVITPAPVLSPLPSQPIAGIVQTGRPQSSLEKHLQKSIEYHRKKQAQKQAYLDRLVAKRQPNQMVAVLQAPYVVTYAAAPAAQPSRHETLKQLNAQRRAERAKKYHERLAAIHAQKAQKYGATSNPTGPVTWVY